MKESDKQKVKKCLKKIENSKDDSSRMFRMIEEIQLKKTKNATLDQNRGR